MSTVVLTPTHIACDHTVIHKTYPHHSSVNCHHQKIFVNPENKYIVGHVGEFNPDDINKLETWKCIGFLLALLTVHQKHEGFATYLFQNTLFVEGGNKIDCRPALEHYKEVFDFISKTFIVTRSHRFVITYDRDSRNIVGRALGPYAGIGSGGMVAAGMLIGGMPLEKIWEPVHSLDSHTSQEYTAHALSSLKIFRIPK